MSFEFHSTEQPTQDKAEPFALFTDDPTPEQLEAYFGLELRDLELIWANSRHLMRVLSRKRRAGRFGSRRAENQTGR